MLPRFHLSDIFTVGHHIGTLIVLIGVLMCIPLAVALLFGEFASAVDFVFGFGCCLLIGSLLRLLKARRVDRRCSLLLTGFSWLAVGLMAAIPMFLSGSYASFVDALFDSVSSITTTGASLASNLDALSYSQIVWHAILTLAGGQAVIVIAVYMGFFGEGSFATVATTRGYSDLVSSDFAKSSRTIWIITGTFTVIGTIVAFCIGVFIGLPPAEAIIDAFCLAANAANTGGFVPHTSSLVYYHCVGIDAFVLVFLMLGAVNVGIFSLVMRGKLKDVMRNSEFQALIIWMVVFIICVAVGLARDGIYTTLSGQIDRGMFMAIASITTSGMQTVYPDQLATCFSDGLLILLILATFLGASACSTGGGVKILRVMEVLRWFGYTIFRAILPDNARLPIRYYYFGTKNMSPVDATHAMTIMILYLAFGALGAMAFIAHGNDALASVFESVSYICNSGVTVGIMSPSAPFDLKLVAIVQMWAGRLEFIALIAALAGVVISLRPLPPNAGGGRAGKRVKRTGHARTPWHKLEYGRHAKQGNGAATGSAYNSSSSKTRAHTSEHLTATGAFERVRANGSAQTGTSRHLTATGAFERIYANDSSAEDAHSQTHSEEGQAKTFALVVLAVVLASSLTLAPFVAAAAQNNSTSSKQGGAEISASQIESLKAETVESYREMEISDLLGASERLDERRVQISGTVYGHPIRDKNNKVWINIRSKGSMIGIVVPINQLDKIKNYGSYRNTGDTLTIKGVYNRTCPKHHGELDVHATKISVKARGEATSHPVKYSNLGFGLLFCLLGGVAIALKRILHGKNRRNRIFLKV